MTGSPFRNGEHLHMSRHIEFEKLLNTRDLGGMVTVDGLKIRQGKLIRSGHLSPASEKDRELLAKLIDTTVDFRTDQECTERPEPVMPGVRHVRIPILDEQKAGVTRDQDSYAEVRKKMLYEAEISRKYIEQVYTGFITSGFSRKQYGSFVRLLLEDHEKAVLWHCTAGKDRAGFATVIIQELLGVSRKDITKDYLMTNTYLEPEIREIIGDISRRMGYYSEESEKALRYMFAAWEEYLEAAYRQVEESYGNFDGYIYEGLQITPAERNRLKELYLEPL